MLHCLYNQEQLDFLFKVISRPNPSFSFLDIFTDVAAASSSPGMDTN